MERGFVDDYSVTVSSIEKQFVKQKNELSIFLILSGKVALRFKGENVIFLQADDLFLLNAQESCLIEGEANNLILRVCFSSSLVSRYLNKNFCFQIPVVTSQTANQITQLILLRKDLLQLALSRHYTNNHNPFSVYKYIFNIFWLLFEHFRFLDLPTGLKNNSQIKNKQINRILDYIDQNHQRPVSLKEIAEIEHVSVPYLSKKIKNILGVNFLEYVNRVRLDHAVNLLLVDNRSIIKIAMDCGFTNMKTFNKLFKDKYQSTPSVYRNFPKSISQSSREDEYFYQLADDQIATKILEYVTKNNIIELPSVRIREISLNLRLADASRSQSSIKRIVNIGPGMNGLIAEHRQQLKLLKNSLRFEYVRLDGFCSAFPMRTNKNDPFGSFYYDDLLFDYLYQEQLLPIVVLSLPGKNDLPAFCEDVKVLLQHFYFRLGDDYLDNWQIEFLALGNQASTSDIHFCYQYAMQYLRGFFPAISLGINAGDILSKDKTDCFAPIIETWRTSPEWLPDFISCSADSILIQNMNDMNQIDEACSQAITDFKKMFTGSRIPDLYLVDWNTLAGVGFVQSGTFYRAALIAKSLIDFQGKVQAVAFSCNHLTEQHKDADLVRCNLSLFGKAVLKRPVYFVLELLQRMQGGVIAQGDYYLLTGNQKAFYLLLYNPCFLNPHYATDQLAVESCRVKIYLLLSHIPAGEYVIKRACLDANHGALHSSWLKVGGLQNLDLEMEQTLEQYINPEWSFHKTRIQGSYTSTLSLNINACELLQFTRQYESDGVDQLKCE